MNTSRLAQTKSYEYLIKSENDASNFIFKIDGIDDAQMIHSNSITKIKDKFNYIRSVGGSWSFFKVAKDVLRDNLTLLDLGMAQIVAACMAKYYSGEGNDLATLTRKVSNEDPLHINNAELQPMYCFKMKQFLMAFALGMTVNSPWNGKYDWQCSNSIYNFVNEICRSSLPFEDQIFNRAIFVSPDPIKDFHGKVYRYEDSYFIELSLQISIKY